MSTRFLNALIAGSPSCSQQSVLSRALSSCAGAQARLKSQRAGETYHCIQVKASAARAGVQVLHHLLADMSGRVEAAGVAPVVKCGQSCPSCAQVLWVCIPRKGCWTSCTQLLVPSTSTGKCALHWCS